jgi:hypothetical protein
MSERAGVASSTSLAGLIGKRVTIRLIDGVGYRDIVGILQDSTSLINRHGEKIDFAEEKIAIWREVVAPPDRAGSGAPLSNRIMELELLSNKTWPAPTRIQRGGWLYRSANGFSFRANSVLPHGKAPYGEPLKDLDEEIDFCIDYYQKLGLKPTIAVPLPIFQELDLKLGSLGWKAEIKAHFLVKDISGTDLADNHGFELTVNPELTPEWIALQGDGAIKEIMQAYPASYLSLIFENEIIGTINIQYSSNNNADASNNDVDNSNNALDEGCIEIIKSGNKKGLKCGSKKYDAHRCKRHFNLLIDKSLTQETIPSNNS